MSLVWDLRSRLSHLKDILFGLEAMEAENSLGQHSPHRRRFNESSKCSIWYRKKSARSKAQPTKDFLLQGLKECFNMFFRTSVSDRE